ncbi:MAG TPA: phosphotriesterase [Solirubrobacterales bacterium]
MIETVLGTLEPGRLGPTSMHEHLLSDASALGIPDPPDGPVADVVLDDAQLATTELGLAAVAWRPSFPDSLAIKSGNEDRPSAGDRPVPLVVDPTVWGFGGPDARLAEISRAIGVAIVAGVGSYVPRTRPHWLTALDEDGLVDLFRGALTDRLPGCDFRAGIVGMLSPGFPLDGADRRLLRAGARTAAETGSAAIVRLDPRRRDGLDVLEVTTAAGLAPERVVLSNVDGYARDLGALRELATAGATLKWCFGYEAPPRPGLATATDAERADAVASLLAEGHDRQVLACGVWTKAALHQHGGWGYDHLPTTVLPMLRDRGLTSSELHHLLVTEPRRLLDRP